MLFSPRPKDNLNSLYGREAEVKRLRTAIEKKNPLIIITGFRRVGKTSLLKATLQQYSRHSIYLDLRDLGAKQYITRKDIANLMESSVREFLEEHSTKASKILDALKSVRGVNVAGTGFNLEWTQQKELDLRGLFSRLDKWAKSNRTSIVLAVDEAQELRKSQHLDMNSIFASIYDNCNNIILILTGSEIGVLGDFLALEDAKAPLFGRNTTDIEVKPLSMDKGMEFLRLGLKEAGLKINVREVGIVKQAAEDLGGIIGWLNNFGLACMDNNRIDAKLIQKTKREGAKMAKAEFEKFLSNRAAKNRYEVILRGLARKDSNWKEIKDFLEIKTGEKVYDKNFNDLLNSLIKSRFIDKKDSSYHIIDPLLKYAYS